MNGPTRSGRPKMTPARALRVVAKEAIARGVEGVREDGWEDFPEIGEHDWEAVCDLMERLTPRPDHQEFADAYHLLEARAEHSEQ